MYDTLISDCQCFCCWCQLKQQWICHNASRSLSAYSDVEKGRWWVQPLCQFSCPAPYQRLSRYAFRVLLSKLFVGNGNNSYAPRAFCWISFPVHKFMVAHVCYSIGTSLSSVTAHLFHGTFFHGNYSSGFASCCFTWRFVCFTQYRQ